MNQNVEKNVRNVNKILSAYLGIGKDFTQEQLMAISETFKILASSESPTGAISTVADRALSMGRFGIKGML